MLPIETEAATTTMLLYAIMTLKEGKVLVVTTFTFDKERRKKTKRQETKKVIQKSNSFTQSRC